MNAAREIMVEVKNLAAGYGRRVVLENVSFQVRRGEVFVILGRSGSGKSTLLKHIIGLHPPLAGEVWIEGRNFLAAAGEQRRNLLRSFGVVYQSGALFGSMTVLENVRLPLEEFTDLPAHARDLVALARLKMVGLAAVGDAMPSELSGGMQKRAALARAMALDPRILFLDEPSVGLDPVTASELDELIRELSRDFGITFVLISHDMASVQAIGSQAILVDDRAKGVIARGTPAELRERAGDPRVRRFFHRDAASEEFNRPGQSA